MDRNETQISLSYKDIYWTGLAHKTEGNTEQSSFREVEIRAPPRFPDSASGP